MLEKGKVPVTLSNGPAQLELLTVPKHKKNPDVGVKTLYRTSSIFIDQEDAQALSQGEEVCFRSCSLCAVRRRSSTSTGGIEACKVPHHISSCCRLSSRIHMSLRDSMPGYEQ